ncbi:MAG TPA: 6-phosphogluconolactonase [Terriglobales bacterium]|nr:6-phosphogluconolactonase [Terriglobales bacterium]
MKGERRVYDSEDSASRAAAELFCERAAETIARADRFVVALTGGSTPRKMYRLLGQEPYRSRVQWERIDFFWSDERAVPPEHADSNFRIANEGFLAPLAVPPGRIHRMPAEREDLDQAARDYQAEMVRVLGGDLDGAPPQFDWLLLGMGSDGHVASLFPGSPALQEEQRWVVGNPGPGGKGQRMTFTLPLLNRGKEVVFLVAGADKGAAIAALERGEDLPAQRIAPQGPLIWILDQSAASL